MRRYRGSLLVSFLSPSCGWGRRSVIRGLRRSLEIQCQSSTTARRVSFIDTSLLEERVYDHPRHADRRAETGTEVSRDDLRRARETTGHGRVQRQAHAGEGRDAAVAAGCDL